jgi:hypothetical protein
MGDVLVERPSRDSYVEGVVNAPIRATDWVGEL